MAYVTRSQVIKVLAGLRVSDGTTNVDDVKEIDFTGAVVTDLGNGVAGVAVGGSGPSSRFLNSAGSSPGLTSGGADIPITYDAVNDYNDLGLTINQATGLITFVEDAEYLFVGFAEWGPTVPAGTMCQLTLETVNSDAKDWIWERVTVFVGATTAYFNPDASISGVHKVYAGDTFTFRTNQQGAPSGTISVRYASLTITKLRSI